MSLKRAMLGIALLCASFVLLPSQFAFGQVDEGSITGTVTDSTGAVVPDAEVTLLNTDQGLTLQTHTGAAGAYTFAPVRIGHYTVTVTAKGFATTTQTNLTVQVAQALLVNVALKPGTAAETVQVTEAPPQLQTEEASTGQVIGRRQVDELPLNGRNIMFLAQLGAGMQTPQADTRGNAASGAFSANGERPAQNNYLLDGIDNNSDNVDFLNGTNYVILPPPDAIQEFKVQTSDYSAQLGRAAGAVLNATVKSGTNSIHGDVWEFFRNDKLDAADWFEDDRANPHKGEYRFNQFGATAGGPIIKNKLFFFGDYQGTRRVQGTAVNAPVPTANERKSPIDGSAFTDLQDVLSQNSGTRKDILGRTLPTGTVLDPATTRFVASGAVDPVSGLTNSGSDGYVRDPFSSKCGPSTVTYTLAACSDLNILPANRLDPKAIALLNLYPAPNSGLNTYSASPALFEHANQFDTREDFNPNDQNQIFARFSWSDDPQFIPGPFKGVADGGAFQQGIQTAKSAQMVAAYTHVFSPNVINQARAGYAHLHTTRAGPVSTQMGIPAQYGIPNIPQFTNNGGLTQIVITGLQTLGSNQYLPSDEATATLQITDDFTRIYGKHSFKMGLEFQDAKFSTLQPVASHGTFQYQGVYTDIPTQGTVNGIAQFLLTPTAAPATINGNPNPNGYGYSGGANSFTASNINKTYDMKKYLALYFEDDWKLTPKMTLNMGVRYDYFGPINETNGGQANFVPAPLPAYGIGNPTFIVPASGKDNRTLSTNASCIGGTCAGMVDLLAANGITLDVTNKYGQGLLKVQKALFAPRIGLSYQITRKLVGRGGFGTFYNSFENQGYGPNIGENYPFVFNFGYGSTSPGGVAASPSDPHAAVASQVAPVSYNTAFQGCPTAGPTGGPLPAGDPGTATIESGFSCLQFNPSVVNAKGIGLQGLQFNYQTPTSIGANLSFQYSVTNSLAFTAAYVYTHDNNLQRGMGYKNVTQILPVGISTGTGCPYGIFNGGITAAGKLSCVPFPDFGGGSYQANIGTSSYHGLQTTLQQQFSNGLNFLFTYTYSKSMSNAGDLLNGTNADALRAVAIPELGPKFDYSLSDFDIRQVLHFSGGYELPFGKDKMFLNHGGFTNTVLGGWSTNWILTLQGGQPLGFACHTGVSSGPGCNDIMVAGQNPQLGIKTKVINGVNTPVWIGNPAAFTQACTLGGTPTALTSNAGSSPNCVQVTGAAALGFKRDMIPGPGFHRLDFSMFKSFKFNERMNLTFRSEFYNIANHPNFNQPNFGGNGVVAIPNSGDYTNANFGAIGSTRGAPYNPRQIQFSAKLYY
ncbi:MAG TPA: carboxypeptidase-like regulatory domain-containing protein [Terracidiphilus sp.]|nr:carboxypeptidase-like regulatory domain-containing protein [Terracidiphilus sp.]